MAILDDRPSSATSRTTAPAPQRKTQRIGATDVATDSSQLDSIDRLILRLERATPGPHVEKAGVSRHAYFARLRRMLYDREANDFAPEALARLRTELLHPQDPESSDPTAMSA